jgi:hypothetical protein
MAALEFQEQFAHLMRFAVARWSPVSDGFLEIMACATSGRLWPGEHQFGERVLQSVFTVGGEQHADNDIQQRA